MDGVQGIPAVDLADFTSGDPARKQAFVNQLGQAYETIGFVAVRNHAIDPELQEKLYSTVQEFFQLPVETKRGYEIPELAGQRGYVSFGREHAKDSKAADLKEFWHFGQEVDDGDPIGDLYPNNVKVSELPHMHEVGMRAYRKFEETGRYMLRAIAIHLGLEETYFDDKMRHGNSILRPIHYPPITQEPDSAVRAGQHEDINLMTSLPVSTAAGLELLTRDGEWMAIEPPEGVMVCDTGDMMQRITNGRIPSTTHRVLAPPGQSRERYSVPFFVHPRPDVELSVLPSCSKESDGQPAPSISAGRYLAQRLRDNGVFTVDISAEDTIDVLVDFDDD